MSKRYTVRRDGYDVQVLDNEGEQVLAKAVNNIHTEEWTAKRICKALNLLDDLEQPRSPIALPEPFDRDRAERRHVATVAMQGLLACPTSPGNADVLACDAVRYVDALLARLNRD